MNVMTPTPSGVPVKTVIGRRWMPWRSRTREWTSSAWDLVPTGPANSVGDDPVSAVLGLIWFVLVLPFMIPALLMTPLFLIESLLQWIVMPFAILLRMMGVLDVEVDARQAGGFKHVERVSGWGAAKERMREIAHLAAQGAPPPYRYRGRP